MGRGRSHLYRAGLAANESYDYADAMLAERAKRQEGQ